MIIRLSSVPPSGVETAPPHFQRSARTPANVRIPVPPCDNNKTTNSTPPRKSNHKFTWLGLASALILAMTICEPSAEGWIETTLELARPEYL